mmetsp:Transcript_75925/g.173838  ORF Transcript_75925/g.173838 Transcript_75925/m.173838 type:complete len:487 (-) Transcript_75925:242-1702(-)
MGEAKKPNGSTSPTKAVQPRLMSWCAGSTGKICDQYLAACRKYEMKPEPGVIATLQSAGNKLHVGLATNDGYSGCLLPLTEILISDNNIKTLCLSSTKFSRYSGEGNANARVLRFILEKNRSIEVLDLRYCGIDDYGVQDICHVLRENPTLKEVILRGNYLGDTGGHAVVDAVADRLSNKISQDHFYVDVAKSNMGYDPARRLVHLAGSTSVDGLNIRVSSPGSPLTVCVAGNFVTEEIWNAISHGIGIVITVVGALVMHNDLTTMTGVQSHHKWGCFLFILGLFAVFISSTLYHSLFLMDTVFDIFRLLDHCAIFLLIAGSYSPLLLFYGVEEHHILLQFVWIVGGIGILLSCMAHHFPWGNSSFYRTVELLLYVFQAWMLVFQWDSVTKVMTPDSFQCLVLGGSFYMGGIVFFVLSEGRPIHHTVWHLFVLAAAICHWFFVRFALHDSVAKHAAADDFHWAHMSDAQRYIHDAAVLLQNDHLKR